MGKYLLDSEEKRIDELINKVKIKDLDYLKKDLNKILLECKDASIEDTINYLLEEMSKELQPLLSENLTPGIEIGLKNDHFKMFSFGGKYNGKSDSKDIELDTLFSFDSISKLLTSVIAYLEVKNGNIDMDMKISDYNKDFLLDAKLKDVLKFTAYIKTPKRIDNLGVDETIDILKNVKENKIEKDKYINYYEYNDIGYMILRQAIYDFASKLDSLLKEIDDSNLTYKNMADKDNITGGKLGEEYITPDTKGRGIDFPGHAGLYGNIVGLIKMFDEIIFKENILSNEDKDVLFSQPYGSPVVYNNDGSIKVGKNGSKQYMAKVAGIYRMPDGIIDTSYNKMASADMSEKTTKGAKAATGTSGSWVVGDKLSNDGKFGTYVGGFLTNPYSYVETKEYGKNDEIKGTPHIVTPRGVILGYQTRLNKYKEIITKYGIMLEVITEYIKEVDEKALKDADKTYIKRMTK
ncbi:MAG: hypothetical protein VZS44_01695 [Bacilli bacterium]|nr:hypothetical protein [Bacilli bacterium]